VLRAVGAEEGCFTVIRGTTGTCDDPGVGTVPPLHTFNSAEPKDPSTVIVKTTDPQDGKHKQSQLRHIKKLANLGESQC
jgi:hypothetical protein